MKLYILYGILSAVLIFSFSQDKKKSLLALKIALKYFTDFIPVFIEIIIYVSVIMYFLPDKIILEYFDSPNIFRNMLIGGILGSLIFAPAFIIFPLSSILIQKGVNYSVISIFTTTLILVGILTYPMEKKYFGMKFTIIRNITSLIIAVIISLVTGFFYGEFF
ncbi:MAG TPA: hypothetical protein PLQ81_05885 [bacterium]|nr:hypothetical protein [bacterium]